MDLTTLAATSAEPTGFTAWVIAVMEALGGPGAGLIIALENLFPPLPSEVILPLAGFTASQGSMSVVGAILWTTLGSLLGALALYGIGAKLGRASIRSTKASTLGWRPGSIAKLRCLRLANGLATEMSARVSRSSTSQPLSGIAPSR